MDVSPNKAQQAVSEPPSATPSDPRWNLVQRVATGAVFQKSRRQRDFLLYVCESALRNPGNIVHEPEVGRAVFGKSLDFDGSQDTLVRVQASQLRKRLQQYFSTEGSAEPIIIEIPKGSYMPVFRQRSLETPVPETNGTADTDTSLPPELEPARLRHGKLLIVLGMLSVILCVFCFWLWGANRELRQRLTGDLEPQPAVDLLWQQIFGNGAHTYIVLSDSNLTLFQDIIKYQLTPTEYETQQFPDLADQKLHDPASRDIARRLMIREYTSITDASLVRRLGVLNARHQIPTDVILARDASPRHFESQNVILVGPRRANPWLALFEDRLNFRSRFDEAGPAAYFENQAPLPGEERTYAATWNTLGYCRVAYLPNDRDVTKSVLIISGTEMGSSEAGAEFITTERWVQQLRATLGVTGKQPVPYFEVLLRTHLVISAAPSFEIVAHRVAKP